jgi:WD40 repeat protein/serine/threonine protein kinase/energy-coupling factor transporter ATP-binding protein EcfA2
MDATPTRYVKGYELLERIGTGGFGAVYRAYQSTIRREVAIKIILPHYANHPDFIRRFEAEAQIIARLEHPHITPLYDYWRDPEGAYLVMRLLRGGNLRNAINSRPFGPEAAADMLDQVASALALAHRNHVIHRDIKPTNILMDEDENVYLADFGIARVMGHPEGEESASSTVLGSPDYLSPEQARLEQVTPQSDIYSLGVVLYATLTGDVPFSGITTVERMYKHLNDPLPLIGNLGPSIVSDVNEVIQTATSKNPTKRYSSVLEMADSFRKAISPDGDRSTAEVVEQLTIREQEVLIEIINGASNREIAQKLYVQVSTVKWYVNQIYRKLHVRSRVQAIIRARELNLVIDGNKHKLAEKDSVTVISNIPEPDNPYKGLRAFQSSDADDFFGRERVITRLIKRLREGNGRERFLAIVGPSGSGKSSLVKAGLIPALWRGELPDSERWYILEMVPGTHPFDELEVALMRVAADQTENIRQNLERDERGLSRIAGLILPNDGTELLLVIDQFEEVFTLVEDEAERLHFLRLLHHAAIAAKSRVRIIVTLRADFYDRPLLYPDLGELVRNHLETVLPLSAEELERAILGPAEHAGVSLEEGLAASIVGDVNYQPGALPMLQYTLTELFERRQGLLLTQAGYQEIGGAVGALAHRADELYHELGSEGRDLARQVFLRLVTLGEGTEDTRRRVRRSELLELADDEDLIEDIIDSYAAYRLLSLDSDPQSRSPIVELAHEAILREWERLRSWIDNHRDDMRQQRLLARSSEEWQAANQDASYLLRGARLEQLEAWAAETRLLLTQPERAYLDASLVERAQVATQETRRQEREAVLAQRSRRTLQILVAVMAVATLISVSLSILALDREQQARTARNEAEHETAINRSLVLVANAREEAEVGRGDAAMQVALEAASIDDPPPEAMRALAEVALSPGTRMVLQGHWGIPRSATFSPDGQLILSAGCAQSTSDYEGCPTGELILWDVATGEILRRWEGHNSGINAVAIVPIPTDEGRLVVASGAIDGSLILWDLETGQPLHQMTGYTGPISDLAFIPEQHVIISTSFDGDAILWDATSGDLLKRLEGHSDQINSVELSPDNRIALTASRDSTIIAWDINPESATYGEIIHRFVGHGSDVKSAVFTGEGTTILSNSEDLSFRLWDFETGDEIRQRMIGADTGRMVISPNGHTVLFTIGMPLYMWDADTWGQDYPLTGHTDNLLDVAFSPDGRLAVSASRDGTLRVWNITSQEELHRYNVGMPTGTVDISPDGNLIAIAEGWSEGHLWVFDTNTRELVQMIPGPGLGVAPGAIAFHPNGRYVLVGAEDVAGRSGARKLILWDIDTNEMRWDLEGHDTYLRSVAISPDGRLALSGSQALEDDAVIEGELILWDLETGQIVLRFDNEQDITCIEFNAAGNLAITSSAFSRNATLWDIETGEALRVISDQPGFVLSVVFGPDESTIITATHEGNVVEWDLETGEELRRFIGHDGPVWRVAMAPNDQMLAAGSADGSIILWDYESGQTLHQFTGHAGWIFDVTFNPDSSRLYSASADGTVREWMISDWQLDELLQWINANRYLRDLTCEEREQFRIEPPCDE